ncbi:MAG TPA: DNA polymerase III subunit delta' [Gammaproteobacteria bacterium]|nr:DNA polymerase III subunit delta' [Gammaproteobacteria bacterium]
MSNLLPWQADLWAGLMARERGDRLPHALLLTGAEGVGKLDFATCLAEGLLCQSVREDGSACGECHACGLLAAGSHPDFRLVGPPEDKKVIPIDTIRAVGEFFALTSQYNGRQVIIVHPAEAMNLPAANSLLKTLEEPTPGALLILVCSHPSQLLPTIRSRCQQIAFGLPEHAQAVAWLRERLPADTDAEALLALAEGAPLAALRLSEEGGLAARQDLARQWAGLLAGREDPLAVAAQWKPWGLPRSLQWLGSWVTDLIRLKSAGPDAAISNKDLGAQLQNIAERLDLKALYAFLDQLTEYGRLAANNLNEQLALEDLMIAWQRSATRR